MLTDYLAHQSMDDYQSVKYDFYDEDVMFLKIKDYDEPFPGEGPDPESRWGMVFDGAVNAYGKGIGVVIITPHGSHIPFTTRFVFYYTNNMVEYEACIMGLEEALDLRIKIIDVYGDSALVINQIKGEWDTRHPGLIPLQRLCYKIITLLQ